jgi:hypothetical protein
MATLKDLVSDLKQSDSECRISIYTPSGLGVPCHFHITEIGRTTKIFVDCGGVKRETGDTTFQVWVADDTDHKMTVGKFLKIIESGNDLVNDEEELVFEYDNNYTIGLYGVAMIQRLESLFNIFLSQKRAACLAPDQCGIQPKTVTCCSNKGCC